VETHSSPQRSSDVFQRCSKIGAGSVRAPTALAVRPSLCVRAPFWPFPPSGVHGTDHGRAAFPRRTALPARGPRSALGGDHDRRCPRESGEHELMAFLFDLRRVKPSGVACELASTSSRRPRWRRQRSTGSSPERLRGELRLQRGRAHARHAARHLRQRAGFSLVRSRTTNSGASGSVGLGGMGLPLASSSLRPSGPKASSHGLGHPVTSAGEDECVRRLKEVLIFGFLRERCGLRSGDLAVHRLAASVQPARLVAIEVGSGGAWQPHG
jgi:hypothetical protein